MGQNFAASSASNCMTVPSILAFPALTSSRSSTMYSLVFSSSGVPAAAAVFAGDSVDVLVCAISTELEVRHMMRTTASTITRMVIFLTFSHDCPEICHGQGMQGQDENGETVRLRLNRVKLLPALRESGHFYFAQSVILALQRQSVPFSLAQGDPLRFHRPLGSP